MERLIKDAEKLDKSFKAQRDGNGKLVLSFADVVDGIHIVQQNLGITGTSAEEAGTTIQGSMASVKAAWQDTLTAMGSGKDIDKKLDNFTRSVKKFGENMKPVIKKALSGAV
jgi:Zn-dependent metalloprotease